MHLIAPRQGRPIGSIDDGLCRFLGASKPLNDGSEVIEVSNAEVRDVPAIPAGDEVLSDLVVSPEGEKRSGQGVRNAEVSP